jgi:import inner membrane translocase subunit TIM9
MNATAAATPQTDAADSSADQVRTFREFLSQYNRLSELCFSDCVWDFTARSVSSAESTCAENCAEKFLKMNQRISTRFQVKDHLH